MSTDNRGCAMLGINCISCAMSSTHKFLKVFLTLSFPLTDRRHGKVVKSLIAFSDPTPEGCAFAGNYVGVPDFLVYRWT